MQELKRALDIASRMIVNAGYVTDTGCGSVQGIKRYILKRTREELYGMKKPRAL